MQAIHQQVTARPRRDTVMGMDGWTIPATAVREQVLHNNIGRMLVPGEEIAASAERWNFTPVTLGHPTERGVPKSGKSPDALNDQGVGFVFDARADEDELKFDVFLPDVQLERHGMKDQIVDRVDNGEPIEVSTSFGGDFIKESGTHEGQPFDVVAKNLQPDHFAILLGEKGACSTLDGCGLGINQSAPSFNGTEDISPDWADGEWGRPNLSDHPEVDGDENWNDLDASERQSIAARFIVGTADADNYGELGFPVVNPDTGRLNRNGLLAARQRASAEDMEGVESIADGLWAEHFEEEDAENMDDAQADAVADNLWQRMKAYFTSEDDMTDERIAALSEATGLSEARIAEMDDEEIDALADNVLGGEPADEEPETADNADESPQDGKPEWAANLEKRLDQLEEAAAPAISDREQERNRLVSELAQNERCPYEEDELTGRSLSELRDFRQMVKGADYSGRGGPKARAANTGGKQFMEPTDPWADESN